MYLCIRCIFFFQPNTRLIGVSPKPLQHIRITLCVCLCVCGHREMERRNFAANLRFTYIIVILIYLCPISYSEFGLLFGQFGCYKTQDQVDPNTQNISYYVSQQYYYCSSKVFCQQAVSIFFFVELTGEVYMCEHCFLLEIQLHLRWMNAEQL